MKKIVFAGVSALAFAGGVAAQQPAAPAAAPAAAGDITRAAAIADAERRFAALDADGNGRLDPAEMQQVFEQRRAERRRMMEERLAGMSAEERAQFEQRRAERRAEGGGRGMRGGRGGEGGPRGERAPVTLADFVERAGQRFDRLDLDRDGVITAAEQARLRAGRGGRSE